MGSNRKSFGLDINILMCCIISLADTSSTSACGAPVQAARSSTIVDDLTRSSAPRRKKPKPLSPVMALLTPVFGKNTVKVHTIFEAWVGYAETFSAANDGWTSTTTEYKEARAMRLYRAGLCSPLRPLLACIYKRFSQPPPCSFDLLCTLFRREDAQGAEEHEQLPQ